MVGVIVLQWNLEVVTLWWHLTLTLTLTLTFDLWPCEFAHMFLLVELTIIFLYISMWVVVQIEPSAAAAAASPADVKSAPHTPDLDDCDYVPCQTVQPNESYAKKPLPPVKSTISRAFKWHRSQSVDSIPHDDVVDDSKPTTKATANSKGIFRARAPPGMDKRGGHLPPPWKCANGYLQPQSGISNCICGGTAPDSCSTIDCFCYGAIFIHNVCVATCLQIRVYCHVMIFFIIVYCFTRRPRLIPVSWQSAAGE